jgi:hypothetical protein
MRPIASPIRVRRARSASYSIDSTERVPEPMDRDQICVALDERLGLWSPLAWSGSAVDEQPRSPSSSPKSRVVVGLVDYGARSNP